MKRSVTLLIALLPGEASEKIKPFGTRTSSDGQKVAAQTLDKPSKMCDTIATVNQRAKTQVTLERTEEAGDAGGREILRDRFSGSGAHFNN